jgi:hypothetical protein
MVAQMKPNAPMSKAPQDQHDMLFPSLDQGYICGARFLGSLASNDGISNVPRDILSTITPMTKASSCGSQPRGVDERLNI